MACDGCSAHSHGSCSVQPVVGRESLRDTEAKQVGLLARGERRASFHLHMPGASWPLCMEQSAPHASAGGMHRQAALHGAGSAGGEALPHAKCLGAAASCWGLHDAWLLHHPNASGTPSLQPPFPAVPFPCCPVSHAKQGREGEGRGGGLVSWKSWPASRR
jgi:hypothetical protein